MSRTLIIRHQKENKKKCSLQPLVGQSDFTFLSYPLKHKLDEDLSDYVLLSLDTSVPLTSKDSNKKLILLDATWKYADKMYQNIFQNIEVSKRALPSHFKTAYPRRQPDCINPEQGLASIEALYIAYKTLGWSCDSLLDHYHFKERFLQLNDL